jgi:DNA polymerase-3 subunit beta
MKNITVNATSIVASLSCLNVLVPSRNTMPILSDCHVRVVSTGNGKFVCMEASDGETWLRIMEPCIEADSMTEFCVPLKELMNGLKALGDQTVKMVFDEEKKTVTCCYGKGHFSLPTDNPDEFPLPMSGSEECFIRDVDSENLYDALTRGGFAAEPNTLRPILECVHVAFRMEGMMVESGCNATIARYKDRTVICEESAQDTTGFAIGAKQCSVLSAALSRTHVGDVRVTVTNNMVTVHNNQFGFTTVRFAGVYPVIDRLFAVDQNKHATVDKAGLIGAIRRVMLASDAESRQVTFLFSEEGINVSSENIAFGRSAEENVQCEYEGEQLTISFNGNYMIQALQNISTKEARLSLTSFNMPCFVSENDDTMPYDYAILVQPLATTPPQHNNGEQ